MSQTQAYSYALEKAQPGQIYDIRPNTVQSFAAEGVVPFGTPVMRGADPEKQCLTSDATAFLGVAVFTQASETGQYEDKDTVSVMTDGAVWVTSSVDTVVAGTSAYVTATGTVTNVSTSNLLIGEFLTGGDTGDLVVVELA